MPTRGRLIVVSGPSGVGKTTVADILCATGRYGESVSATTRPPRGDEIDGLHYHFLDPATFEARVQRGEFLEHAIVHGHRYGTLRSELDAIQGSGRHCILNIDVQGAANIRASAVPALFVFLEPPDIETLERRLRARSTDSEAQIGARLRTAQREMECGRDYDLRVCNDVAEDAAMAIDRAVIASSVREGGR